MRLVSVVLSAGAGTRLWPVSRQALPKPFMQLGGSSLLQQAIERGLGCGTDDTLIVTNADYQFLTREVVHELSDPPKARHLLEPKGRRVLTEAQSGVYLGEDDIVRLADTYGRV